MAKTAPQNDNMTTHQEPECLCIILCVELVIGGFPFDEIHSTTVVHSWLSLGLVSSVVRILTNDK